MLFLLFFTHLVAAYVCLSSFLLLDPIHAPHTHTHTERERQTDRQREKKEEEERVLHTYTERDQRNGETVCV